MPDSHFSDHFSEELLRDQLTLYLSGDSSLDAFREWLAPRAFNVEQRVGAHTAEIVHEVDLLLAESDHGDWTEDDLKAHFRTLLQAARIEFHGGEWLQQSSTAGTSRTGQTTYIGMTPQIARPRIEISV